jgi:hypothetical protein
MLNNINKSINAQLPPQQVPLKRKLQDKGKWGKDCMDSLESIGRIQFVQNLALKENYEIIKGRFIAEHYFDKEDIADLSSTVAQEFSIPKYLKHYDITSKAVNILVGEFIKRPDIFRVSASGNEADSEFLRTKTEMLQSYMQGEVHKEVMMKLQRQGVDVNKKDFQSQEEADAYQKDLQQKEQELTPKSIEKYMRYDYRSAAESWGESIILNDTEKLYIREKEQEQFEDVLVADRCFAHYYLTSTGYDVENWNPINTFFHYSPEVRYLEEGDFIGRVFFISKAQIIDRYGWKMTQDEIESLYPEYYKKGTSEDVYTEFFNATMYPWDGYRDFASQVNTLGFDPHSGLPLAGIPSLDAANENNLLYGSNHYFTQRDLVQVTEAYWRSQRKIGKLILLDEQTGEPIVHIVDENFNPKLFDIEIVDKSFRDSDEPNTICWTWAPQTWKGIKINANYNMDQEKRKGMAIYLDIAPNEFQFKGDYNPFNSKLPVCGQIFNNRNGRSMALVDLLKPYQIFYNMLYNQAYEIAQKNLGKFFLMDVNIIPSLKDWGSEEGAQKFMTIAKSLGLGIVDARPQNTQGSNFAHFQQVDMSEHDKVQALINLAMLVEQQAYMQIGITPQRAGQVQASETATGTTQAVNNSYAQTESYFEKFYNYKKRKLKMHLDIAQFVALREDDITMSYVTSDLGKSFIKVNGTDLMLRDLGVNIINSQEAQRQLEAIRQLAINNNTTKLPMSKLVSMVAANSVKDLQKMLEQAESELNQNEQAMQSQQKEMQDAQLKVAADEAEKARENENMNKQLDRETKIREAEIKATGYTKDGALIQDVANQSLDAEKLEFEKLKHIRELALQREAENKKNKLEGDKLKLKDKELNLKEKESKIKATLERERIQADKQIAKARKPSK